MATPVPSWAGLNMSWNQTNDNFTTADEIFPSGYLESIIIPVFYCVVSAIGLTGNTLVIYVVLRYAKLKTVTYMYIMNMACADDLFLMTLPFLAAYYALHNWPFGLVVCKVVLSVDALNQFTSIFCLVVMSFDRYLAVVHPVKSVGYRTPSMARYVNISVWAVALVMTLPVAIFATTNEGKKLPDGVSCNMHWPDKTIGSHAFTTFTFVCGFVVPLSIIVASYLLLTRRLRSLSNKTHSREKERAYRRIERLVYTVVFVFVVCWLPFHVFQIGSLAGLFEYIDDVNVESGIFHLVSALMYVNSCCNPLLYGYLDENIKRCIREATCSPVGSTPLGAPPVDLELRPEPSRSPRLEGRIDGVTTPHRTLTTGLTNYELTRSPRNSPSPSPRLARYILGREQTILLQHGMQHGTPPGLRAFLRPPTPSSLPEKEENGEVVETPPPKKPGKATDLHKSTENVATTAV
ncbi:G-protein coupled receptor 1 [Branchiostoma belcheri]|nr:G-protein coupled receptor 1 [Branchiostoma belcheri]